MTDPNALIPKPPPGQDALRATTVSRWIPRGIGCR